MKKELVLIVSLFILLASFASAELYQKPQDAQGWRSIFRVGQLFGFTGSAIGPDLSIGPAELGSGGGTRSGGGGKCGNNPETGQPMLWSTPRPDGSCYCYHDGKGGVTSSGSTPTVAAVFSITGYASTSSSKWTACDPATNTWDPDISDGPREREGCCSPKGCSLVPGTENCYTCGGVDKYGICKKQQPTITRSTGCINKEAGEECKHDYDCEYHHKKTNHVCRNNKCVPGTPSYAASAQPSGGKSTYIDGREYRQSTTEEIDALIQQGKTAGQPSATAPKNLAKGTGCSQDNDCVTKYCGQQSPGGPYTCMDRPAPKVGTTPGNLADGETCKAAHQCLAKVCVTPPSLPSAGYTCGGYLKNSLPCREHRECGSRNCVNGVCSPPGTTATKLANGKPCSGDNQCQSKLCKKNPSGKYTCGGV